MELNVRKPVAWLLTLAMLFTMLPSFTFTALAADNLCEHHAEHTAECGYVEGVSDCAYHCDVCLGHDHGDEVTEEDTEPAPVCDCGTDDESIHATTCAVYVAPENPVCYCAEKCTEVNEWCDVCGFDYTACTGTDTAVGYAEGDVASVTIGGETTYYTSIKDAVAKANESGNATITLLQDTTTGERLDITNSATLDLNGNTLSCTAYFADDYETMVAITTNNTKLTIIDSVGGGKLDGTGTDYALMLGEPGAYTARSASAYIDGSTVSGSVKTVSGTSMTVSGSTVESNSVVATIDMTNETTLNIFNSQILNTHSSSTAPAIDNSGTLTITDSTVSGSIGVDNRGTANISGNTNITGTVCSVKSRVESQDSTLTITGGNYTGGINITGGTATISGGSYTGDIVVSGGTATISGGTITASSAENAVEVFDSAELTISGGTFSAIAGKTYDTGVYVHDGGTVKIIGGTITSTAYGVYNDGGSATITGGTISGGTVDLQVVGSDSILNLTLDEGKTVGATFPGGITAEGITLAELLATDTAAYWGVVDGKDTMLTVADAAATGITDKGDITIRTICDHKDVKLDYDTTETTHTPVCSVCNWTGKATEHTGGTATCQGQAVCEACGVSYGDKDANIHTPTEGTIFTDNGDGTHSYTCACGAAVAEVPHTLDVTTGKCVCGADMTAIATVTDGTNTYYAADAATLNQAVTAILETGSRTFTVELPADAEAGMIIAIRRAICDTEGVADGSIHLTLKGVTTIPGTTNWDGVAFGPGDIYDEAGKIVDQELVTQLASINLPDVTEIGAQAFYFCENLVSVSAPKAQTIGAQALGYTALTSVEFPELTTIPTDMFSGTWTLSSAKFPKVTTIEQGGLLVGAKFTPENNPTPFPLELTAEGNITFNGSNHFNIASQNYSGKVDLVLCCDKKDAVTFHDDGTATWQVREDLSYTFKSITFKHSYVDGKCTACGEDCAHTGGTATCTTPAVCESCGASYGEVGGHSPNAAGYTVNADGTHSYTCSSCGNPFTESHTFTDGACTGCGVIGGYCGEEGNEQNVIWTYANGTLTISGTGAIADQRDNYDNRPWEEYVDQITTIVVNDGITSIGEAAFWRFQKLTTAKLPDSLTTISQQAFYGCTALKTVNFPANLKTIEGWAFLGCALESVTLPEGLTTIGYRAFSECKNLTSVTVPASVTTIDEGAFGYSPAKITVAEDNPNYSSDEHGVLFDKDKTTLIYCRLNIEVETYTIPSTVTEICKEAFYGCENLATITIPDGVQKIGSSAFGGCEALTTITIPAGVTTIEANTFYDCTALTAVTIPAGVTTIDMWAFSGCTALTTVTIPASVTSIAYNAFSNCSALTTVNVPCTWDGSLYTFDEGVTVNKVHNWVGGACTVCGVSCDHTDSTYTAVTDKGDGTHSFECSVCGETGSEAHNYKTGTSAGACACGAACPHSNFDPATGNCTDCETSVAIAKIKTGETTTYYQTADELSTAIENNSADQAITLLADFEVIRDLCFYAGKAKNTLDLNGHTLTGSSRIDVEYGELTITGTGSINIYMTADNKGAKIVVGSGVTLNDTLRSVYGGILDLTGATIPEAGLYVILYSDDSDPTTYNVSDVLLLPADYYFFVDGKAVYTYSGETEGTVLKHTDHSYTYTDNGDGTHKASCTVCGYEETSRPHTIENHVCTACGAMEIVVSFNAGDYEWKTGDTLYFCRVSRENEWEEYCFTATVAEDGTVTWTPDKTLYWDDTGKHKLVVVYPGDTPWAWDRFYVGDDQTTTEKLHEFDLMNAMWSGNPTTDPITLNLKHRLAKVTVNYEIAEGVTVSKAEVYTLTQYLLFDIHTLERKNIAWEEGHDLWINSYHNGNQFTAFVSPDAYAADGNFIKITLSDGSVREVKMNKAVTFAEGAEYTYKVVITADGAYLTCTDECSFEYTANEDGLTHSKTCSKCGYVAASENHTLTYTTNGSTITESCSANCGHTGTATISAAGKTYDGNAVEVVVAKTGSLENTDISVILTKDGEAFTGEPVNAGAYTASVTLGGKTVSVNFTIAKAEVSIAAAPTPNTLTYIGEAQYLISAGEAVGGTMVYSLTENGEYTTSIPQGTNAGDYTVWYYVQGDANHKDSAKDSVSVSIAKAPLTVTADAKSKPYGTDNPALTYTSEGLLGDDVLTGALETKATKTSNVGEYDITVGSLANSNYTIDFVGAKLTITKADSSCTAPVAVSGLTFNGGNQSLITAGTATGGTMQYSLDGSNWSETIPTGKDAKTYTVYYKVVGDGNHNDADGGSVSVTIAPKVITNPVIEGIDAQYLHTGSAITPAPTAVKDGNTIIDPSEYTLAYENNINEGTATLKIVDVANGNYTVSGSKTFQIVVHAHVWNYSASGNTIIATCNGNIGTCPVENKTVTIKLNVPENLTYDGNAKIVTVTQSPAGVFTDIPAVTYGASGNVNAGTHTASLTYGEKTATLEFTIAAATPTVAWDNTTASVEYTGSAASITAPTVTLVNGETFNGTISYSHTGTSSGSGLPTNAGTYEITASIAAQDNYTAATSMNKLTLTITAKNIAAADIAVNGVNASYTYTGNPIQPTVTSVTADGKTLDSNEYEVTYGTNTTVAQGGSVIVKLKGNYSGEKAVTFTILASDQADFSISGATTAVFGGNSIELTATGGSGTGAITWEITSGDQFASIDQNGVVTIKGAGTVTVKATKAADGNYKEKVDTHQITISKATVSASKFSYSAPSDLVYSKTAKAATVTGDAAYGAITIKYYSDSSLTTVVQPINVGIYYVGITTAGGSNYEAVTAPMYVGSFTITARIVTVTADAKTMQYGDDVPELTYTHNLIAGDSFTGSLGTKATKTSDVGEYDITIGDLANSNYTISFTGAKLTITKANGPAAPTVTGSYVDNGMTYTYTVNAISGAEYSMDGTTWQDSNVFENLVAGQKYTFYARIKETKNVMAGAIGTSAEVDLSKLPGKGTVIIGDWTYGEAAKAPVTNSTTGNTVDSYLYESTDGKVYSSANAPTNAGEYKLTVTFKGTATHNGTTAYDTFTIAKATPVVDVPTGLKATYGDTLAGVQLPTGWTWKDAGTTEVGNAGENSFTVIYTKDDSGNYNTVKKTVTITVAPKVVTATVTVAGENFIFNGSEQKPGVTVKDDENTIPESEYTVTYANNTNAGTATVTITDKDGGNYTVTGETTFAIAKKASSALSGVEREFMRTIATTGNEIDVEAMLPDDHGTVTYTITSNGYTVLENVAVDANGKLVFDTKTSAAAASDTITVEVVMQNYTDVTLTVSVILNDKAPQEITGVTAQTGLIYNGEAQKGYTGTPASDYTGAYEITYTGRDNSYNSSAAPVGAGDYTVTFKIPDSDLYYSGNVSINFTIGKAQATVTADDKEAYIGSRMPELTYKVSGLIGNDTISVELSCDANMYRAGDTPIVVTATDPNGNYEITTVNGTLTVESFPYIPPIITPTYPPVVDGGDNGDVVVSPMKPEKGDTVTIIPNPDSGYEVDEIIVTDKNGNPVTVVDNGGGTYSFKQPSSKVNIEVTFKEIVKVCPGDKSCPMYGYTDLDMTAWYHDGVHFCIENKLMNGTSTTTFAPGSATSRAMIVTILWRLAGEPVVNYAMSFEDVAADTWYTEAIRWAASEGIVNGYSDTAFGPNDNITREQLATILYRYEQKNGGGFKGMWMIRMDYVDLADVSDWAYEAMCWMNMNSIVNGRPGKILDPKGNATRAEAAAMLYRYCDSIGKDDEN